MSQPVIFVIDGDAGVTAALREDLGRRFGEDFRVIGESSADSGLAALRKLAGARSSGSPPRSVTVPRPCAWCTNT